MGRRSALIIVSLAVAGLIFKKFYYKKLLLISLLFLLTILIVMITSLYSGSESFDIQNALFPRIKLWTTSIAEIKNASNFGLFLGVADGWSTQHNTLLDLIYHTGLLGVSCFTTIIIVLMKFNRKFKGIFSYIDFNYKHIPFLFLFLAFSFDNLINTNLYLLYYSVNMLVITLLAHYHFNANKFS